MSIDSILGYAAFSITSGAYLSMKNIIFFCMAEGEHRGSRAVASWLMMTSMGIIP